MRKMNVFLTRAEVKAEEVSNFIVFEEEGKAITIQKKEKHQDDCWKGWLPWPNWEEIKLNRLFVVLRCGHFFTARCFLIHPFNRCPHCNFRLVPNDKTCIADQLYNNIEKIKMSKSTMLKKEAMFMVFELYTAYLESDFTRWTEHVAFMFNYHEYCSIPCIMVFNEILKKNDKEKEKISKLITFETIMDRTKVVIPMTENSYFMEIHLDFLRMNIKNFTSEEWKNNIDRLQKLKNEIAKFSISLSEEYLTSDVRILLKSIMFNIKEEIERNNFAKNII